MKNKKLFKGRTISTLVLGLAAVSLIGVGFSAWVIQTQTTADIESVTVNVADVKNNSVTIEDAAVSDSTFVLDAKVGDNQGAIIYEGSASEDDYSWSITFAVNLTEEEAYSTEGKQVFNGFSLTTNEKYTVAEGDTPLYTFPSAETDTILELPATFGGSEMPLVDKNALNFTGNSTSIYLNRVSNGTVSKVDNSEDANISVSIAKALKQDDVYTYTFTVEFTLKWGEKYKGFNPSLCDGADASANSAFGGAENLPDITSSTSEGDSIEKDLNLLRGLNGHQINHTLIHDPLNAVTIN